MLLASAGGGFFGCGVQGTPHPPRLERPAQIQNLTAVQVGQSVEVRFSVPRETTEGARLTKPLEIEILDSLAPEGPGLAKLSELAVRTHLRREEWLPYAHEGNLSYSLHMTDQEFHDWSGHTVVLGVRTLTRGFRHRPLESDPSNLVDVPILDVSEPVANIQCVVTEKAVEVKFAPPTRTLRGGPVEGLAAYQVYRSSTGQPGSFELLGDAAASPYRDRHFEFGQTYYYQVRAAFGPGGHLALSEASRTAQVTPRDIFPPAPPQGLQALYSDGAVELVWSANTEPDLAGYNAYRLGPRGARKLNQDLLRTPVFRDAAATAGTTLTYYVTAVDLSGNESQPSEKEEVETQ